MASQDPEVSAMKEEDAKKADLERPPFTHEIHTGEDQPTAPDQFNPRWETTKWEIWSYYSYYIGNNGLSLFNFGPTAFQSLLSQAAGDAGVLVFLGSVHDVVTIVLISNGISFAIQVVLLLIIGSYADFGRSRPNILIFWSLVAWGIGFGWLGVYTPDKWPVACGLYIIGLIAYQMSLTFWTAAFPGLARNTVELREKANELTEGTITRDEYDYADTIQRSRLSNMAFYIQSLAELVILAIIVGIMWGLRVDDSVENNNYGTSVLIAFATGVWLLVAIPWFFIEKRRPGATVPPGMSVVTVGLWNLWRAFKEIRKLRQSLIYFIGYLLLGDSLNTTVTVVATLQNTVVAFSTLKLTYLFLVGIAAQAIGIFVFWQVQKRFKFGTKTMFSAIMIAIVLLDGWGMIGIWTDNFGFHNEWEFWLYQVYYGLLWVPLLQLVKFLLTFNSVCPWYSYSQIMISEVTPRGKEFLFFSLYSIIGKASSFIGPFISVAIVDDTPFDRPRRDSTPFYFLFALSLASFIGLFIFVDLKKSRIEQAEFLEREKAVRERRASVVSIREEMAEK